MGVIQTVEEDIKKIEAGFHPATPAPAATGGPSLAGLKQVAASPDTESPVQELLGLGIGFAEGGKAHAKFSYPGGYTATVKNELGEEMEVTFNGDIDITVKPAGS